MWFRVANASKTKGYNLYNTGFAAPPQPTFSKANGLGEFVAVCTAAPIEIGNRVWDDLDGDGVQDPNEPGLDGVTVQLFSQGGAVLATAVTANGGQYYFSSGAGAAAGNAAYGIAGLTPNTDGIPDPHRHESGGDSARGRRRRQTPMGRPTATAEIPTASWRGPMRSSTFDTGAAGASNHTFDFGFTSATLSVGNFVWFDTNDNGVVDAGEQPMSGVDVVLYRDNGNGTFDATTDTFVATQATVGGAYLFTGLAAGNVLRTSPGVGVRRRAAIERISEQQRTDCRRYERRGPRDARAGGGPGHRQRSGDAESGWRTDERR